MEWSPVSWYSTSRQFLGEVRNEFNKVTWPPRKEASAGTIGVLVIVAVLTLLMSIVDGVLGWLVQRVLPE